MVDFNSFKSVLVYEQINIGKYASTKHFQLQSVSNGCINDYDLTNLLNVSNNRSYAKSDPVFWVQTRVNNKWQKPRLTGLFETKLTDVYKGDTQKGKNNLIFEFSENKHVLKVYYFENSNIKNFKVKGLGNLYFNSPFN